jgi:homospermidine synthase
MPGIQSFRSFRETITEAAKPKKPENHANFDKKILIIGYGSVGQAILPMILKHISADPSKITVIEKDNHGKLFRKRNANNGVKYIKKEILPGNLIATLEKYTEPGSFIVDVSLNISAKNIIEWCLQNNRMYVNTSLERWGHMQDEKIPKLSDRTLYHTHGLIRDMAKNYPNAATVVSTGGANPGLVTYFTKAAMLKIAEKAGRKVQVPTDKEGWAQLAKKLGVEVIHIAERDTQVIDKPKMKNEFVNTWSCEGFWAEGRAPAEMGYGTHEPKELDGGTIQGHTAFLHQPGMTVLVKSWVPKGGPYNGFLVQHSEAITMSEYFQTEKGDYRPSVYYVYQPCDAAIASVHELRGRELTMQTKERIIKDEIVSGIDELGVLLICKNGKSYWHGSQLDINEARRLIPGENATSLQVVSSILGEMMWAIQNPNRGYIEPEDLPHEFVLEHALPYLGAVPFVETDWRPEEDKNSLFPRPFNKKHPNALENFRVWT